MQERPVSVTPYVAKLKTNSSRAMSVALVRKLVDIRKSLGDRSPMIMGPEDTKHMRTNKISVSVLTLENLSAAMKEDSRLHLNIECRLEDPEKFLCFFGIFKAK